MSKEIEDVLNRLEKSTFRSKFHLSAKDKNYIKEKGLVKIQSHAIDFINKRLTRSFIPNDGKQTPMRGHPVFIAQHGTATCCRGCLEKWHKIRKDHELTKDEQEYIVEVIMTWLKREYEK